MLLKIAHRTVMMELMVDLPFDCSVSGLVLTLVYFTPYGISLQQTGSLAKCPLNLEIDTSQRELLNCMICPIKNVSLCLIYKL